MSVILKNFTPEQYYELMRNKVIADNVGLTNFNEGSDTRAILEAVSLVAGTLGYDFLEALRQSIPLALYTSLGFTRKPASISTGFLRFYRQPNFYITYSGTDLNVTLDITTTQLILTTSGTPADDLTLDFTTYDTIAKIVTEINNQANWSALQILLTGTPSGLYKYTGRQIVGNTNYLNISNTVDVLTTGAAEITLYSDLQASVGDINIITTIASTIPAGDATSPDIAAESIQTGPNANIDALAINTIAGNGVLNTSVPGVEYVINDSAFANGADEETDEERASRFETYIQGLHGGTVKGIESDVLEIDAIKTVTLRERIPIPGTNTIIADDGTGSLSLALIAEIRTIIDGDPDDLANFPGAGVAGITYNIEPPTVIPVDVTATVYRIGTISDSTEILTSVQSAIERYINTRRLGDDVVISELNKRAKGAHPAVYDFVLVSPGPSNVSANLSEITRTGAGTAASVTLTLVTLTDTP